MENESKLVTIVDLRDNAGLDLDALSSVLCQPALENKPLVIIGIAGALRTGKSFLMTFLMRYLRNKGWKNPQWIGDDETCADDGIAWSGGRRAHTKGIVIWNEIFAVEKDDGEEIAVLLLDTQGLFDQTMSREENLKIFTFTVLLTSHLMLNIKSQIDERELGSLEFFTEYARTATAENEMENNSPFQDLMFLIRDWQYPDDNPYGLKGGMTYLREILENVPRSELNVVRQNLRSTFQKLDCFLMPYPGDCVTNSNFVGRNKDIKKEFLNIVKELANTIFHPGNLKNKSFNGKYLTGRELWTLLKSCNETFENGEVPVVENMVVAFAKMKNKMAVDEALKIFEDTFVQEQKRNCKKAERNIGGFFEKSQQAALEHFEKEARFGGEDIRRQYRLNLISECQDQFKAYANWDELRKLQAQNFSSQKLHEIWSIYRNSMKKEMEGKYQTPNALNDMHRKNASTALKSYQTETAKSAAFHKADMTWLEDDLQRSFEKFKIVNDERHSLEAMGEFAQDQTHERTSEDQNDLTRQYEGHLLLHQLSQQYREELEIFTFVYIKEDDLENQINILKESYFGIFENCWSEDGANIESFRASFSRILQEECEECLNMNSRNKNLFDKTIEESTMRMKAKYCQAMHGILKSFYCDPTDLEKAHRETAEKVTENLTTELKEIDVETRTTVIKDARKQIDIEFETFQKRNAKNRQEKPRLEAKTFTEVVGTMINIIGVAVIAIRQFCAIINKGKTIYNQLAATARILPSIQGLSATLPSLTIGAVVVVGAGVAAYCVYRHYNNKKDEEEMIEQ